MDHTNIKEPEISVIVPAYNVEKYIERCLFSLIDQDIKEKYEIIVINDGSTDNSLEMIEALAAKHDIIRVYSQKNGGLSAARNAGITRARGKYIAFVDSDDYVEMSYLSAMYRAAECSGADIVCCNFRSVKDGGGFGGMDGVFKHRGGVYEAKKLLNSLLLDISMRNYAWNKLYRRGLFTENNIEFPVGKIYEDMRTIPRLFYHSRRIAVVSGVLYNYVQHEGSITGTMTPKKVFSYIDAYGDIRRLLDEKQIYPKYAPAYIFQGMKNALIVIPMLADCKRRDPNMDLAKCCILAVRRLSKYSY